MEEMSIIQALQIILQYYVLEAEARLSYYAVNRFLIVKKASNITCMKR